MYKLNILLLVNFFAGIHAPDMKIPETLHYKSITEVNKVDSFSELKIHQALPLVVFLDDLTEEFEPAENLSDVFTHNGRIINGTRFTPVKPGEQIFFCPEENSTNTCLVRQEFQGLEPLQCTQEPRAIVRGEQEESGLGLHKCGFQDIGTSYTVIYDICSVPEPNDYVTKEIPVYAFCYDTNNKKTLFTNHGIIYPKLLFATALYREQSIKHRMEKIEEYIPSNYDELEMAIMKEELNLPWVQKKHGYKAQKLVPPEDMSFALWKKPTHQYFNLELQHENLIDLWNEINEYIRINARKTGNRYCISTGVFELNSKPRTDVQMSNVWVKIVYQASDIPWEGPSHAVVVLMDNFIESATERPGTSSNRDENEADEYCEENLCVDSLKVKFQKVEGRVRCCALTIKMMELFGMINEDTSDSSSVALLIIPGINSVFVSDLI